MKSRPSAKVLCDGFVKRGRADAPERRDLPAVATASERPQPVKLSRRLRSNTFSAFGIPAYRWFWASSTTGTLGYQMQAVALGWLVYVLTGSAVNLGLITTVQAICQVIASPIAACQPTP